MLLYFILVILSYCSSCHQYQNLPSYTVRLHGNVTFGYYYIDIHVGTPPQIQSFIIDTASHITAIACQQCQDCNKTRIHPNFNKKQSASNQALYCNSPNNFVCDNCHQSLQNNEQCKFSIRYMEGSEISGNILQDVIIFSGLYNNQSTIQYQSQIGVSCYFGCTLHQSDHFKSQVVNGIIGLAPNHRTNLLQQIYKQNKRHKNFRLGFSLCFAIDGGFMTVGRNHEFLHNQAQQTNIFQYQHSEVNNFYSINFQKITVGGNTVYTPIQNKRRIIIDSGSSYTYFIPEVYQNIYKLIEQSCHQFQCFARPRKSQQCFIMRGKRSDVMSYFPNISINFGNDAIIQWTANEYFVKSPFIITEYCLAFEKMEGEFILGASWMKNKDIFFDLENKKIEITKSSCLLPQQLQQLNRIQTQLDQLPYYNSIRSLAFMGCILLVTILISCYINNLAAEKKRLRDLKKKENNKIDQQSITDVKKNK